MMNLDYFYVPPLPETLINCLEYMYNENFDYDILIKKVTTDIGLTEKIFSIANSQYYARGQMTTYNLKQAITRIGSKNLLQILSTEYYKNSFKNVDIDFFTLRDFNKHASYVSHLAVVLGESLNVEDTNDLMIAGLFHDVGLIARSHCQNKIMQNLVQKCREHKTDFNSVEKLEVVPTHGELGKLVANKWKLTDRVSYLIENHHPKENENHPNIDFSLRNELDILTFADTLAHRMKFGYENYVRDTKVSKMFLDRMGLSVDLIAQKTADTLKAVGAFAL